MTAPLTGWCSPAPTCTHTEREHRACEQHRPVCGCQAFGGHQQPRHDEREAT